MRDDIKLDDPYHTTNPPTERKQVVRGRDGSQNKTPKTDVEGVGSDANCYATKYFHNGNDEVDVVSLLDCAYDVIEIWNTKESPYNEHLKRCWLKRARELGATPSL